MNLEDSGEEVPIQLFEICLEREEFFPGEVVTGKLLVVTSRPLNTEGKPNRLSPLQTINVFHIKILHYVMSCLIMRQRLQITY